MWCQRFAHAFLSPTSKYADCQNSFEINWFQHFTCWCDRAFTGKRAIIGFALLKMAAMNYSVCKIYNRILLHFWCVRLNTFLRIKKKKPLLTEKQMWLQQKLSWGRKFSGSSHAATHFICSCANLPSCQLKGIHRIRKEEWSLSWQHLRWTSS